MIGRKRTTVDPDALVQEKWRTRFGTLEKRWLQEEETAAYAARRRRGRFTLTLKRRQLFAWVTNRTHRYDNFVLDGTVHFDPSNGHSAVGFVLRYVNETNFYYFLISDDGHFRFDLVFNGNPSPLISWTATPPLNRSIDEAEPLSLRIVARDGRFVFLADEEWIGEVDDDTIRVGKVAFAAQNFDDRDEATFFLDRLALSSLPMDVERDFFRWTDTVPADPTHRLALARSFYADRQYAPAVVQLRKALRGREGEVEELFLLAESLIQLRMYREALQTVDRVLVVDPDHQGALHERGNLLYLLDRLDEAYEHLAASSGRLEAGSVVWNLRGNVAHALGRFEESEQAYRQALQGAPDMPLYAANLARTLLIRGKDQEALTLFRQAARELFRQEAYDELSSILAHITRLDPDDIESSAILGKIFYDEGKRSEAEKLFVEVIARGYHDSAVSYLLGLILTERGRRSEAALHLRAAAESEPTMALYRFRLAENQFLSGQDCHAELEAALEADANDPWIRNLAGQVAASEGRTADAEEAFARAYGGLPGEVEVVVNHTSCLQDLGRSEEALKILDTAVTRQTENPRLLNQRGNILVSAGRLREALVDYEAALILQPDDVDTIRNAAGVCIELDLIYRAEELLAKITDGEPTADVYNLNASLALVTGERGRALLSLKKGLELDPTHVDLRLNLASLYLDREDIDKAKALVTAVLSDAPATARASALMDQIHDRWEEQILCAGCDRSWWVPRELPPQPVLRLVGEPPSECPAGRCSQCGKVFCISCASVNLRDGRMLCLDCCGALKLDDPRLRFLVLRLIEARQVAEDASTAAEGVDD